MQQRTKDGMFNATAFLQQWSANTGEEKHIYHFLANSNTQEFILALVEDIESEKAEKDGENCDLQLVENQQVTNSWKSRHLECVENQDVMHTTKTGAVKAEENQEDSNTRKSVYLEDVEFQGVSSTPKKGYLEDIENKLLPNPQKMESKTPKSVMVTVRGNNGGTWMHPLLFIKFAMWLNPRFEVQVLKFVQDKMLQYRNDAGEAYKELSSAIGRIVEKERMHEVMSTVGKGINYILWNKHEDGERNNHAEESEMRRLFDYERHVAALINDEFITDADQLMAYLRRQWNKKWNPIKALA